ncbi:plasmid mobilization relaxosome protein MobC [Pedobacter sp. MC2016-24]|uniref:plasmid mobilization protein n=1 Tax=Pedobacter sp. MC2016-24 TaxID=2780090 RepID=UPI001882F075|nr:plasmid mobilization relaxosome protein MobC [Pedobacter sp. MC2016-24]MBE9599887.1 plasmid mobilization relaxosome protein MobC [Pedobacter sp. MC2016-24]
MAKKLKGRPLLSGGQKNKHVRARFTEEEFTMLLKLEQELGISRTNLIRQRVLNNAQAVVINARELISLLDRIGTELGRSGNNINQLAKYANTLNKQGLLSKNVGSRFVSLLQEFNKNQTDLEVALRKIIRTMSRTY